MLELVTELTEHAADAHDNANAAATEARLERLRYLLHRRMRAQSAVAPAARGGQAAAQPTSAEWAATRHDEVGATKPAAKEPLASHEPIVPLDAVRMFMIKGLAKAPNSPVGLAAWHLAKRAFTAVVLT